MSAAIDPNSVPKDQESTTESSNTESGGGTSGVARLVPRFSTLVLIVIVCAATSFPAALIVSSVQDTFGIPAEYDKYSQPPPHILVPMMAAQRSAQRKNAGLALGICGGLLCGILGLTMGITVRSTKAAILGALDGVVAGGLAGAIGGIGNALLFRQFLESSTDEMYQAMVIHAPAWIIIGLAAGSVAWVMSRSWSCDWRVLLAGAGAGLVSAAAFPILCIQAFPDAHPAMLFPDKFGSLVLWIGLPYALIALAVIRAAPKPSELVRQANRPVPSS